MHPRQAIREGAKTLLSGNTAAATRVFETRVVPFHRLELPAIAVYTLRDSTDEKSALAAPRELKRTLELAVEVAVKASTNVDDTLDDICAEIESAMNVDETMGDNAADSFLASTEMEVVETGDKSIGLARLVYSVTYYTPCYEDDSAVDLETVNVTYDLAGEQDAGDQAEDVIDLTGVP